jgi:hypothetical protein
VVDIFQEVDEEVRRERLQKLWQRYGGYAVGAAVALVLGIGAWRGYEWWQMRKAAQAGSAFESAMSLSEKGKHSEAEAAFAKVAADGTASYRIMAELREAAEVAQTDPAAGVKAYDALISQSGLGPVWQDLAGVRAGILLEDTSPYSALRMRLEPLAGADRTFRHTARELLAFSAWRSGDMNEARRWGDMIATDAETPAGIRSRVEVLMGLVPAASKG